ncbi:Poly(R)-hydroxyalkanoic acid synthase class III PhaE subunit [Candidatus Magnetomorum sp. HK-1]|nr:Poly(R)-hydroxyalkanoic acid synthase class III PhaE subunit [Candidatus Magnetomorum sp. HK-1]
MAQFDQDQNIKNNMNEWMQSAMNFWKEMSAANQYGKKDDSKTEHSFTGSQKTDQFYKTSVNMFQLIITSLFEPDNIDETFKNTDTISSASLKIMQQVTESFMDMQKQWLERSVRIGKETKAYSFDDLDPEMFKRWKKIYENEFQQFFHVPTLGLFRYYQERINLAIDKFNLFHESLSEFLYVLYVPFEKTAHVLQKEIEIQIENGKIPDNYKDIYNQWIRILEGHYMSLLQSKEYAEVLNNTTMSYVQFKKAKDAVMMDLLQHLPIPTQKEMDELYKEIYELKQSIRSLKKSI